MSSPEAASGAASGSIAGNGNYVSVSQETESASSGTDWGGIAFLVFWAVGLTLLIAIITIAIRDKRRRQATRDKRQRQAASVTEATDHQDVEGQGSDRRQNSGNCLPYGAAMVIPIFFAFTAFAMSIVPHKTCAFIGLSENDELLSIGMWSVAYVYKQGTSDYNREGNCYSNFPLDFEVNTAIKVARASAIIATVVGGMSLLVLIYCSMVLNLRISQIRRLALPLLIATFFQGLTLCLLDAEECSGGTSCYLDDGTISAITAAFYWFVAAVGISLVPLNGETK